ncbi:MAG: HD domain-containing protein [Dehalococcoidia bacterium]|nr:HD domain-containing protein [Dehalococcoidia bacterium]
MRQRVRQFCEAGQAPNEGDLGFARNHLSGNLFGLFSTQTPRDQLHAIRTARWLTSHGYSDPNLIVAALLHDVAKGKQRRIDRVAWVIACRVHAGDCLASERSHLDFRRALARSRNHAWASAEAMRAAGAPERAVELARLHHRPPGGDRVLALLQQADAAN